MEGRDSVSDHHPSWVPITSQQMMDPWWSETLMDPVVIRENYLRTPGSKLLKIVWGLIIMHIYLSPSKHQLVVVLSLLIPRGSVLIPLNDGSGQIVIFHQPGFLWNQGISLTFHHHLGEIGRVRLRASLTRWIQLGSPSIMGEYDIDHRLNLWWHRLNLWRNPVKIHSALRLVGLPTYV